MSKFRGIPRKKDEFRGKFRGKNPNSAARLQIPRPAENCGPYSSAIRCKTRLEIAEPYEILLNNRFKDNWQTGTWCSCCFAERTYDSSNMAPDTVEQLLEFTIAALNTNQPEVYWLDLHKLFWYSNLQPELHNITDIAFTLLVTTSCAERAFSKLWSSTAASIWFEIWGVMDPGQKISIF